MLSPTASAFVAKYSVSSWHIWNKIPQYRHPAFVYTEMKEMVKYGSWMCWQIELDILLGHILQVSYTYTHTIAELGP